MLEIKVKYYHASKLKVRVELKLNTLYMGTYRSQTILGQGFVVLDVLVYQSPLSPDFCLIKNKYAKYIIIHRSDDANRLMFSRYHVYHFSLAC